MTQYKSFVHVLRLNRPEVEGYLNGKIYVSVKMDGTSAVMYCGDDGKVHYGSRTREVTPTNDNAGFATYCEFGDDAQIAALKQFVLDNPNLIVFGEWLAGVDGRKLAGTIKAYLNGGFYVFAVFDVVAGRYLTHDEWVPMLDDVYDKLMRPIAVLDNPTEEEVDALLDKTGYDLPPDTLGEGIVLYNFDFRDDYDHPQFCKIVRSEYLDSKKSPKKRAQMNPDDLESEIAKFYITDAEIGKEQNKIMLALGEDTWVSDNKHIGRLVSTVWHEFVADSLPTVIKKYHNPTINFAKLNGLSNTRVRQFLGL